MIAEVIPVRVSRRRESNLQSVGWSWLPGASPPACSSLCNTHCNSAHRHLLGGARGGHGEQTGSRAWILLPSTAVLSFTAAPPAPAQECPKHLLISSALLQVCRAMDSLSLTLCSQVWKGLLFHKQCLPFVSCQGKREARCKGKIFFSSGDEAKGTGTKPSRSQKLLTWRKKPRTIRSWRKSWDRDSLRKHSLSSDK